MLMVTLDAMDLMCQVITEADEAYHHMLHWCYFPVFQKMSCVTPDQTKAKANR